MAKLQRLSILLFMAGFFTVTWDLLLTIEIGGFTLKVHQALFLVSFSCALIPRLHLGWSSISRPLREPFAICILALAIYYAALSPWSSFPLKSGLYAGWLFFNLCTIWITSYWLSDEFSRKSTSLLVLFTLLFHSAIIAIDHFAYQYGHIAGLIGHNQDEILRWGASRPHAFSSEPSYIAAFLSFGLLVAWAQLAKQGSKLRYLSAGALFLGAFAIVTATSRTGWISLIASVLAFEVLNLFYEKRKFLQRTALLGLLIGLAVGFFLLTTPKTQRSTLDQALVSSLLKGTDGSGNTRLQAHHFAWEMAKDTHFLGTGMGASYRYWAIHHGVPSHNESVTPASGREIIMSTWGQLLAEGGAPAVIIYLLAGLFLVRIILRRWRSERDPLTQAALASALVFFCFTAFFLGNVARGDVWVWFAIWSRMALPEAGEEAASQRA